jgi:hypothetical protein
MRDAPLRHEGTPSRRAENSLRHKRKPRFVITEMP